MPEVEPLVAQVHGALQLLRIERAPLGARMLRRFGVALACINYTAKLGGLV